MSEPLTLAFALRAVEIHLTFATLVALAAWAVTSSRVGASSATTRYWIWVATSLNFVLPVGVFVDRLRPPSFEWVLPLDDLGNRLTGGRMAGAALVAVWAIGSVLMLVRLLWRIRSDRARPGTAAPAVDGLLRPRISVPAEIERLLTAPELDAVLLHEQTHARRRDNLIRLAYEVAACAFWFHPLVWLAGSRLSFYRELSCDESVVRGERGGDLVSALAKLANPAETLLLQSGASSFLSDRVTCLTAPLRTSPAANALQAALFALVLLAGILGSAFQANLMHRAGLGEFCPRLAAELAARAGK